MVVFHPGAEEDFTIILYASDHAMIHEAMKNNPSNTVYISNLSYKRDRNGLRSLFSRYGSIKNIKIIVEPETNQSRGMAFVEMGSVNEATMAIKGLHGVVIDNRTLKANYATTQRPQTMSKVAPDEKKQKDLEYTTVQLAKKARNEARRKRTLAYQSFIKK